MRGNIKNLVGQFASGMTSLLGNLDQGWTAMSAGDGDAVARQFCSFVGERSYRPTGCHGRFDYNNSQELPDTQEDLLNGDAGGERVGDDNVGDVEMDNVHQDTVPEQSREVHNVDPVDKGSNAAPADKGSNVAPHASADVVPMSKRGRDSEDSAQVSASKRLSVDPFVVRKSEATAGGRASIHKRVDPPSRSSARLKKGSPTGSGTGPEVVPMATHSSPRLASSNMGDPVVLQDLRKSGRRQKKNVGHMVKTHNKDPLNRIHSKLGSSLNAAPNQPSNTTSVADRPTADSSSAAPVAFLSSIADALATTGGVGGASSEELISPRTEEVVPALFSMRHGAEEVVPIIGSDSVEVHGAVINRDNEEADPSAQAGTCAVDATVMHTKVAEVSEETVQRSTTTKTVPPSGGPATTAWVALATSVETVVYSRKNPRKRAASSSSAQDQSNRAAGSGFMSASSLFPLLHRARLQLLHKAKGLEMHSFSSRLHLRSTSFLSVTICVLLRFR